VVLLKIHLFWDVTLSSRTAWEGDWRHHDPSAHCELCTDCHNITVHKNWTLIFYPFKISEYWEVQKMFIT